MCRYYYCVGIRARLTCKHVLHVKTLFVDFQTKSPIHSSRNHHWFDVDPLNMKGIQNKEDTAHFTIQIKEDTLLQATLW